MMKIHKLKHNLFRIVLIAGMGLTMLGCSQINTSDGTVSSPLEPAQVTETQEVPASPTEGNATQMIPTPLTSSNPSLQSLIEKAKDDLAQRLSISMIEINLVEAVEVEWSDSSLDCPQPGMEYLQVITPGYRILLGFSDNVYEYHSNRDTYVIYCENSISPNLPKP